VSWFLVEWFEFLGSERYIYVLLNFKMILVMKIKKMLLLVVSVLAFSMTACEEEEVYAPELEVDDEEVKIEKD